MAYIRGLDWQPEDIFGLEGLPDDVLVQILLKLEPVNIFFILLTAKRFTFLSTKQALLEKVISGLHLPLYAQNRIEMNQLDYTSVVSHLNQLFNVAYSIKNVREQVEDKTNNPVLDHMEQDDGPVVDENNSSASSSMLEQSNEQEVAPQTEDTNNNDSDSDADDEMDRSNDSVQDDVSTEEDSVVFSTENEKKPIKLLLSGINFYTHYKKPSRDLLNLFLLQDCYGRNAIDWAILKKDQRSLDFIYACISLSTDAQNNVSLSQTLVWNSKESTYFNPQYKSLHYYCKLKTKHEWAAQCNQLEEFEQEFKDKPISFAAAGLKQTEFFNNYQYYGSMLTVTAHEGHVPLMEFILAKAEFSTPEIHRDVLISSITAAVTGGQLIILQILLDKARAIYLFDDDKFSSSLSYLALQLIGFSFSSDNVRSAVLKLFAELNNNEPYCIGKLAQIKTDADLLNFVFQQNNYSEEQGIHDLEIIAGQALRHHNASLLTMISNSDILDVFPISLSLEKPIKRLGHYLTDLTRNFTNVISGRIKKEEIERSLIYHKEQMFGNRAFIKNNPLYNMEDMSRMLFRWIINSTLMNSQVDLSSNVVTFDTWEKSLDFILSLSVFPRREFLSCLFESLNLFYTSGDKAIDLAKRISASNDNQKLYINMLDCFIRKGFDLNTKFDAYGMDSVICLNLINEVFCPINQALLAGVKVDADDLLTPDAMVHDCGSFEGFFCSSDFNSTKNDQPDLMTMITFTDIVNVESRNISPLGMFKKIHPDYFLICMNFDIISALNNYIYILADGDYSSSVEIDPVNDDDVTISLKSLQIEIANNLVPFEESYHNWHKDPFNQEVMDAEGNQKIFADIKWLLDEYNLYYKKLYSLYRDRILRIEDKKESSGINSDYPDKLFQSGNRKKRDLATSQTTDRKDDQVDPNIQGKRARLHDSPTFGASS